MSQYGYPGSGAPQYPQGQGQTSAPYPTQGGFPDLQKPGAAAGL